MAVGLAQRALRRKKAAAQKIKLKQPKRPVKKAVKKPIPRDPVKKPAPRPKPVTPVGSTAGGVVTPTPTTPAQPANPYVEINSNGQLDLPYNANYSWEVLDAQQEANKSLLSLQQQQQQGEADYQSGTRDLDRQYGEVNRDTLNHDAGKGLAYTSVYGNHVANNATDYNNQRTDLDTQHNQGLQNAASSRMQIQNGMNDMLRQSALVNAQQQAAQAGTLGYGKGAPTPAPIRKLYNPKPVKKAAPKPKKKHAVKKKGPKKRAAIKKAAHKKLRPIR